jgi:hypothetical protein
MKMHLLIGSCSLLILTGCGQQSMDKGAGRNGPAGSGEANQTDGALKGSGGGHGEGVGAGGTRTPEPTQPNSSTNGASQKPKP